MYSYCLKCNFINSQSNILISAIDSLLQDLIEEQYGERYAQKLEERLSHYLEELKKALPHPTHIEQVCACAHFVCSLRDLCF